MALLALVDETTEDLIDLCRHAVRRPRRVAMGAHERAAPDRTCGRVASAAGSASARLGADRLVRSADCGVAHSVREADRSLPSSGFVTAIGAVWCPSALHSISAPARTPPQCAPSSEKHLLPRCATFLSFPFSSFLLSSGQEVRVHDLRAIRREDRVVGEVGRLALVESRAICQPRPAAAVGADNVGIRRAERKRARDTTSLCRPAGTAASSAHDAPDE